MQSKKSQIIILCVAALVLSGCGMFKKKPPEYLASSEQRTLEIPDDLDSPSADASLIIPGTAAPSLAGKVDHSLPPKVLPSVLSENANSAVRYGADGVYLILEDSIESVWRRLGFALKRTGMQVSDEQEQDWRYDFYFNDATRKDERGFFKKMLRIGKKAPNHSGDYRITLQPEGESTRLYLQTQAGDPAEPIPAEKILGILQERLG